MDYSETVVTLMITVMASAAAVRSTTAIADARDTARACLEGLRQPAVAPDAIEVAVHDGGRHAPRMRTLDLSTGTGGFGWPMVNRLAYTMTATRRASSAAECSVPVTGSPPIGWGSG